MGVMGMDDPIAVAMTGDVRYRVGGRGEDDEADASRSTNADGPNKNFESKSSCYWSSFSSVVFASLRGAGRNGAGDVLELSDVYRCVESPNEKSSWWLVRLSSSGLSCSPPLMPS